MKPPLFWDRETDVVVVGGGASGLPAAIAAAEAGSDVILLETTDALGGSFRLGIGDYAIAGSDEQKALGIEDSPEIFYQDLMNVAEADPEIARAYADNQLDAYRLLKEVGTNFPGVEYFPGHSRDRELGWMIGMGPGIMDALERRARKAGVDILLQHRGVRLFLDPESGRVSGIEVTSSNEKRHFKVRRAVILANGSFGRSPDMVAEYAPKMLDCPPLMPEGHRGDGLRMGLAVGAATKDIGIAVAPSLPICIETHSPAIYPFFYGGIAINSRGERFYEESASAGYYGMMTGAGVSQPGGTYWALYDQKIAELMKTDLAPAAQNWLANCRVHQHPTIEAMATHFNIDPANLKSTVDSYNRDIDVHGFDTAFGRRFQFGNKRALLKIDAAPFLSVHCITSTSSFKGGLRINGRAQVIDNFGEVIPGLYAAGELTGGLHTKIYMSGTMSSAAMTFGIIAGRNAAAETLPALLGTH